MSDYCNPPTPEDYLKLRMTYPAPQEKQGSSISGLDFEQNKELKQDSNLDARRNDFQSKGAGQELANVKARSHKSVSRVSFRPGAAKAANNIVVKNTATFKSRSII